MSSSSTTRAVRDPADLKVNPDWVKLPLFDRSKS
jgi:hypothetical protein